MSLPFPTTPYSASWMPEGAPPIEFIDTSQADGAIFLLIVPPYMAMSSWESDARKNAPDLFEHRLGIEKLSDVRVHTSRNSPIMDTLEHIPGLEFSGSEHLV